MLRFATKHHQIASSVSCHRSLLYPHALFCCVSAQNSHSYHYRSYHNTSFPLFNNHQSNHHSSSSKTSAELFSLIQQAKSRIDTIAQRIQLPRLKSELHSIQQTIQRDEHFWDDAKKAQQTVKRQSFVQSQVEFVEESLLELENHEELLKMIVEEQQQQHQEQDDHVMRQQSRDEEETTQILNEIQRKIKSMSRVLDEKDVETLLNEPDDKLNCFMEIYAGAGGMDTNDWAEGVMNMYVNWCTNQGFQVRVQDVTAAKQVGIKHALLSVSGSNAYGWLKNEHGVHRFVRCSPFDSNNKRHTSFVGVNVYPEADDDTIDIELNVKDLKIETMRASGAGGQHVNKTDSAVRIAHLPTGLSVSCQDQRDQHQNRKKAMKVLQSKLYMIELNKRQQVKKDRLDSLDDVAFGSQIRSYVFHPYKLVKDLRTNSECTDPDTFMAGEGDYLKHFMTELLELKFVRQEEEELESSSASTAAATVEKSK